jgi:hypothetical protein
MDKGFGVRARYLGCGAWGLGFGVKGWGVRVQTVAVGGVEAVQAARVGVVEDELKKRTLKFQVQGLELRYYVVGFRVKG